MALARAKACPCEMQQLSQHRRNTRNGWNETSDALAYGNFRLARASWCCRLGSENNAKPQAQRPREIAAAVLAADEISSSRSWKSNSYCKPYKVVLASCAGA